MIVVFGGNSSVDSLLPWWEGLGEEGIEEGFNDSKQHTLG